MPRKLGFLLSNILVLIGLIVAVSSLGLSTLPKRSMHIGKNELRVQVAQNPVSQTEGLSGRRSLPENEGMAFRFATQDNYWFWMKGMLFPLDFIWVAHGSVVGTTPSVPAPAPNTLDANLFTIKPPVPIDTVIEVNAGWVAAHSVVVGDRVSW